MNCEECETMYGTPPCITHGECPEEYNDIKNAFEYESNKEFENNKHYD